MPTFVNGVCFCFHSLLISISLEINLKFDIRLVDERCSFGIGRLGLSLNHRYRSLRINIIFRTSIRPFPDPPPSFAGTHQT